jgi:hypothetical protein
MVWGMPSFEVAVCGSHGMPFINDLLQDRRMTFAFLADAEKGCPCISLFQG